MDASDILSIAAIVVSLLALSLTLLQKYTEMNRLARGQLTALMLELARTMREPPESGARVQRCIVLTRQAIYLLDTNPKLAKDIDYITIAQGLWAGADFVESETYWKKGIETASVQFMKMVARAGFGEFLYATGRLTEGQQQFKNILALVEPTTDENKRLRVNHYLYWMSVEAQHGSTSDAYQHHQRAIETANSIGNQKLRSELLDHIERERAAHLSQQSFLSGQPPPDTPGPPSPLPFPER